MVEAKAFNGIRSFRGIELFGRNRMVVLPISLGIALELDALLCELGFPQEIALGRVAKDALQAIIPSAGIGRHGSSVSVIEM